MARVFTGFYDSSQDDKREYNSYEFSSGYKYMGTNGICERDDLKVTADTGMRVRVNYGAIWINGRLLSLEDNKTGYYTIDIESVGNTAQTVHVIAQLDINNKRKIDLIIRK
ncbi:MAG: hypothetical protein GX786_05955, partial [Clostridiales bacterium]|nr:hypothetical protein [Clostridiales bacterium]